MEAEQSSESGRSAVEVPVDTSGIVFGVNAPYSYGHGIGFAIWSNGAPASSNSYFLADLDTIDGDSDHFYQGDLGRTGARNGTAQPV